jgi:hypothetical protein
VNNTIIFIGDCNCHFHHYLPKTYFLLTLNPSSMTKTHSTILHILFYLLGLCPFSRSIFVLLKMEPAMPCMACVHHISLSPSSQTPRCYSASLVLFPLERSKEIGCHPAKIWYHPSHLTRPFSSTPNPHPARTAGEPRQYQGPSRFPFSLPQGSHPVDVVVTVSSSTRARPLFHVLSRLIWTKHHGEAPH